MGVYGQESTIMDKFASVPCDEYGGHQNNVVLFAFVFVLRSVDRDPTSVCLHTFFGHIPPLVAFCSNAFVFTSFSFMLFVIV